MRRLMYFNQYDGSRVVLSNGQRIGSIMPPIDQGTIEASPGIQNWSHPRGKVSTKMFDGGASVAQFSVYWERHYARTYPMHDDGQKS